MSWSKIKTVGEIQGSGDYEHVSNKDEWRLSHKWAGPANVCEGGSTITLGKHIDGSGAVRSAFDAKEWPHVKLEVSLPTGPHSESLAALLVKELQIFMLKFTEDTRLR